MVLIAESPQNLQKMLDTLYDYCNEWKLEVNVQKTKIVVFRNGGKLRNTENWSYNGYYIDIVSEFNYLGVLMSSNGKFFKTQKHVAEQGGKALFSILNKSKKHCFNIQTLCSIFDTYVNSILSYGSEIWGFHRAQDVEKVVKKNIRRQQICL